MNMEFNGNYLLQSIKAGGKRIIATREELNKINVFPVADRDTGNNLASLMRSISEIPDKDFYSIKEVLELVAEKALEGAKGNSGMIFAQYFIGIARSYKSSGNDIHRLTQALSSAVKDAYDAIQNPQEGTILTVMNVWSNGLQDEIGKCSLEDALVMARNRTYNAVLDTEYQHRFMKQHKVVDAGAKGFYEFIDGLTDALIGEKINMSRQLNEQKKTQSYIHEVMDEKPTYQYCMEVSYYHEGQTPDLRIVLEKLGDSIVTVHGVQQARVHIHTNHPKMVIQTLQQCVHPTKIKIDDMQQQYFDIHENQEKIALVTDSIADLPQAVINRYNIHILPLTILVDETEHLDKLTLDNQELLAMVAIGEKQISTSLANQSIILRLLEQLEQSYDQALFISVSSKLSGTYNVVGQTLKQYQGSMKVKVIDSKLNSIAQGLLVKQAGAYISEGITFDSLVAKIEKEKESIKIFVSVDDLRLMIASGRVPQTIGKLLQKMKFKPIVTLDEHGFGKLQGIGLSMKYNQRKIKRHIQKQKHKITDVLMGYTSHEQDMYQWREFFVEVGFPLIESVQTSAVIALSAGKAATAVAIKYEEGEQE